MASPQTSARRGLPAQVVNRRASLPTRTGTELMERLNSRIPPEINTRFSGRAEPRAYAGIPSSGGTWRAGLRALLQVPQALEIGAVPERRTTEMPFVAGWGQIASCRMNISPYRSTRFAPETSLAVHVCIASGGQVVRPGSSEFPARLLTPRPQPPRRR